jgi:hypothetical protein
LEYIFTNNLQEFFKEKVHEIKVESQDIGWGFGDNISDIYYEYYFDDMY